MNRNRVMILLLLIIIAPVSAQCQEPEDSDYSYIAFNGGSRDGKIQIMDALSGEVIDLTTGIRPIHMRWAPDGDHVYQ